MSRRCAIRWRSSFSATAPKTYPPPKWLRELAYQFPVNDGTVGGAVNWLLDTAADDAEFNAEVARVVEARRKFPWITAYRATLANWATGRLNHKDLGKRALAVQAELAKSDKEPVNADWIAYEHTVAQNVWAAPAAAARGKLLEPARVAVYPDDVANDLFYQQQYYLRHFSPDAERLKCIDVAKAWALRLPKSFDAAAAYLNWATDYVKPDAFRDAAPVLLKLEPTGIQTDLSRRLFTVAAHFKDVQLATQAWAWTKKMFEKYGYDNGSAAGMGNVFTALNMKAEAKECWDCADRQSRFARLLAKRVPAGRASARCREA